MVNTPSVMSTAVLVILDNSDILLFVGSEALLQHVDDIVLNAGDEMLHS